MGRRKNAIYQGEARLVNEIQATDQLTKMQTENEKLKVQMDLINKKLDLLAAGKHDEQVKWTLTRVKRPPAHMEDFESDAANTKRSRKTATVASHKDDSQVEDFVDGVWNNNKTKFADRKTSLVDADLRGVGRPF